MHTHTRIGMHCEESQWQFILSEVGSLKTLKAVSPAKASSMISSHCHFISTCLRPGEMQVGVDNIREYFQQNQEAMQHRNNQRFQLIKQVAQLPCLHHVAWVQPPFGLVVHLFQLSRRCMDRDRNESSCMKAHDDSWQCHCVICMAAPAVHGCAGCHLILWLCPLVHSGLPALIRAQFTVIRQRLMRVRGKVSSLLMR